MFHFLGTPRGHKRLIVYDTDHWIDYPVTARETLARLTTPWGRWQRIVEVVR